MKTLRQQSTLFVLPGVAELSYAYLLGCIGDASAACFGSIIATDHTAIVDTIEPVLDSSLLSRRKL